MANQVDRKTAHLLVPRPYPRLLSLVIPMYNEESVVGFLRKELDRFAGGLACDMEVILVNDGSSDSTIELLAGWASEDPRIKVLHLSRNFGHQIAATAGLDYAAGDAVVLIDADLQDPLPVVHQMIERYQQGYDVVYGQRASRAGEGAFKKFTAWAFYRLMRGLVYKELPLDSGDFRLMSSERLEGLKSMRETHRFLRGMVTWVGFPQIALPYERAPRVAGETKYPLRKMLFFAWTAATSFSILPLQISILLGLGVGLFAIEEIVRAVLASVLDWYPVPGWTSLMIVVSAVGSATLICLGIVGQYVGQIYEQSKQRPLYFVARAINVEKQEALQVENQSERGVVGRASLK